MTITDFLFVHGCHRQCTKLTDAAIEALAACSFQLRVLLLSNVKSVTDKALFACAATRLPLHTLDLCSNTNITDTGVLALCAACEQLQELRLKGCDRVAIKTLKHCSAQLLPFTKPPVTPTLSQKIATGGASASMTLTSLPMRHIALLQTMVERYDGARVLQTKFRRWKQREASLLFLSRRRFARESRAASKIQRCVRAFLAWRRYLHLLALEKNVSKIVYVQAHARGNACRWRVRVLAFRLHRSARIVQRHSRPHLRAQLALRHASALHIQRVYRGHVGRMIYRRRVFEVKVAACERIWHWYRRCKHRRDVQARTLWLLHKVRSIQSQWHMFKRRRMFRQYLEHYRSRAIRIQSLWRRALARVHVQHMRVAMNSAAVTIQRVFRGFRARCQVRAYRAQAHHAVTQVQRHWRRYLAVQAYTHSRQCIVHMQRMVRYARQVRRFRSVAARALAKHRTDAAVAIQRTVRGWRGRKRALLFRKIRNAKLARRGQNARQALVRRGLLQRGAVLVLQRWVRHVQARRRMLRVRAWRRVVAARCIQRYWKAWLRVLRVRQKRETRTHAAVNLQRVFRGHRGRVAFNAERYKQQCLRSARLLQRIYRGYCGRCLYQRVRKEKTSAALLLQRAFRSRHARKLFEISQAVAALKAKDKYDHSLRGWLDAKRNPMDELYRRAKLPREKAVLVELERKWDAHRVAEERAARKLKREAHTVWDGASETIANYFTVRRKLYGVTENVYASNREFAERQDRRETLTNQLVDRHLRVAAFRAAILEASATKRMLDGTEVFALLREHGLLVEPTGGARRSNQDDE